VSDGGQDFWEDDSGKSIVESENDGAVVDDRDWMTSWMRDRGCWERFRRGMSSADSDDSSALDDVAEIVNRRPTTISWKVAHLQHLLMADG
jgi:hypothetical protein